MDEQHERTLSAAPAKSAWRFPAMVLALAVLAGVGWAVLRPDSSAVSVPVVTPSAPEPSDSPPIFAGSASITFNFDPRPSTPHRTARFEVQRTNDDLSYRVSFGGSNGRASAPGVEGDATTEHAWWYAPDESLEVALIPGYVRNVTTLGSTSIQVAYLARVDLAAVAIERDPATSTEEFFWSDYNGTVRNNTGGALASATVLAGATPVTVFEDDGLGVWGYFDDNDRLAEPIARAPVGRLMVTSSVVSGVAGSSRLNWLGLLPSGATNIDLKADDSVTWGAATLGTTGRLAIAGYTENEADIGKGRTGVRGISYTDASGQRHTIKP